MPGIGSDDPELPQLEPAIVHVYGEATRAVEVDFPAEALKARKLKEIRAAQRGAESPSIEFFLHDHALAT